MLDGTSLTAAEDVSDRWYEDESQQYKRRERHRTEDASPSLPQNMRLVRTIDTRPNQDESYTDDVPAETSDAQNAIDDAAASPRYWHWYAVPRTADDDGSRFARARMTLDDHLRDAAAYAKRIVTLLRLGSVEAEAVVLAAKWHDLGKHRVVWQRCIGNRDYALAPPIILAKSAERMRSLDLGGYRHEFGSLLDVLDLARVPEFARLSADTRDLALHLIAAHHGRARPYFPSHEAFDAERSQNDVEAMAKSVPERFVRLQERYGHWGLAYLESLVRAADKLASGVGQ
jgi:CRISPR-associated endonuclease/helicase Cas3